MPADDLLYLLSDELIDQVRGRSGPSLLLLALFHTDARAHRSVNTRSRGTCPQPCASARRARACGASLRRSCQLPRRGACGGFRWCARRIDASPAHCPSASPLTLRQRLSRSAADNVPCDLRPGALTDTATALRWPVLIRTWSLRTVYGLRVPASCCTTKGSQGSLPGALLHTYGRRVLYVPRLGSLAPRRHARYARYARGTRACLRRPVPTAYRGTTGRSWLGRRFTAALSWHLVVEPPGGTLCLQLWHDRARRLRRGRALQLGPEAR